MRGAYCNKRRNWRVNSELDLQTGASIFKTNINRYACTCAIVRVKYNLFWPSFVHSSTPRAGLLSVTLIFKTSEEYVNLFLRIKTHYACKTRTHKHTLTHRSARAGFHIILLWIQNFHAFMNCKIKSHTKMWTKSVLPLEFAVKVGKQENVRRWTPRGHWLLTSSLSKLNNHFIYRTSNVKDTSTSKDLLVL